MSMKPYVPFFFLLLLLALCSNVQGHFTSYRKSSTELVSDGINKPNYETSSYLLSLKPLTSAELTCEETYGFMPCTTTVLGNLFLMLVYGYLMYSAAKWLSSGSEILLEILGPGIVGGLFLPVLTSLPDAMLILGESSIFILHLFLFLNFSLTALYRSMLMY